MGTRCSFCELPVPDNGSQSAEPVYCCFGCRFAAQVTRSTGEEGQANWALVRLGLAVFFAMNVMVYSMALWSQELDGGERAEFSATLNGLFRYLCLFFALPVLFLLGGSLVESALEQARRRQFGTDLLLVTGVAASYVYSAWSVLHENGPIYFEVGCSVLVFVTLGRWFEANGRLRANRSLDGLEKLLPTSVRLQSDAGERVVPVSDVALGDNVRVLAGERIPCDGRVVGMPVHVDERILTGESAAVTKEPGDAVFAGTSNVDSDLLLEVTACSQEGTVQRLARLVREARMRKGPYERLADRVAYWLLPGVSVIALATLIVHSVAGGGERGILSALSVVVIACPCALGIATPLAVWVALGEAAHHQVVVHSGEVLERLATLRALCFDKTGTMTTGENAVERCVAENQTLVQRRAAQLGLSSNHALSAGIRTYVGASSDVPPAAVLTLPGRGLSALIDGEDVFLGSARLMEERGLGMAWPLQKELDEALERGAPIVCLGWQGQVRGLFVFREQLRPETRSALDELRRLGLAILIVTGDHAARGGRLAEELGVPVRAGLLPEDKLAAIVDMRRDVGAVGMVGDGINDGPALAASDVGFALGCGTDLARVSAGVCVLTNDLTRIAWVIELGRRTVRVIRQNLFWSLAYNVAGIGLACTGRLSPVLAATAMVVSSMLVVANSSRLCGFARDRGCE